MYRCCGQLSLCENLKRLTMTEKIKTFKELAAAEFAEANYASAFKNLWKSGVDEFVSYAEKESKEEKEKSKVNWFAHLDAGHLFWNDFILQEPVFKSLLSSKLADQLLHNYFSKYKLPASEFEQQLALSFPDLFVKAVRVNQVFLDSNRIEFLSELSIDEPYKIHQKVWKFIQSTESSNWELIHVEFEKVKAEPLDEIICHCILWLETSRFPDDSNKQIHHLASVYGFFMELLLRESSVEKSSIQNESLMMKFLELLVSHKESGNQIENSSVPKLMSRISDWVRFRDTILYPYCFDLNTEPVQEGEVLMFNSTPEAHYQWLLDGVRYEQNRLRYRLKGIEFSEYLESETGMIMPGKTEEDVEGNRRLDSEKWATMLLLDDLKHESIKTGWHHVDTQSLFIPIHAFSFNRRERYQQGLTQHFGSSKTWVDAFLKMTLQSLEKDVRNEPFFLMTEKEYEEVNAEALSELPENRTKEIIRLFSFRPYLKYPFDRHNLQYDVWKKPFAHIGDSLFCPMIFFSHNDWFYPFTQVALQQKANRGEKLRHSQEMELYLGELFEKRGWKTKVISATEANDLDGDIDVFVEDDNTLLFIQLKCSYFRLNLKDAYNETALADATAVQQLNDAEDWLIEPNDIYEMKHKPIKWVVSTSFENIGKMEKGCHKINYFDLLDALKNFKSMPLIEFIDVLEKDLVLKHFVAKKFNPSTPKEALPMLDELTAPLRGFDTDDYRLSVFSEDEPKTKQRIQPLNKALKLDAAGKKKQAISELKEYLLENPNDGDAYGAMANILADIKDYNSSFKAFQKALELLPNDPHITRNYAIALGQHGSWKESLKLSIKLYEQFPMLGDIRKIIEDDMKKCLEYGLVKAEEFIELQEMWDRMR